MRFALIRAHWRFLRACNIWFILAAFLCFGHVSVICFETWAPKRSVQVLLRCWHSTNELWLLQACQKPSDTTISSANALDARPKVHLLQMQIRRYSSNPDRKLHLISCFPCLIFFLHLTNAVPEVFCKSERFWVLGFFQETHKINIIIWWFRHLPLTKPRLVLYFLCIMHSSKLNSLHFAEF